jgi:hypothetical protein
MSLKFSLRDLLLLIALISVACAALANTGIWWHSIVVTATLTGMTGLVIWGTLHSGSRRAFACGWLLFAAGYLALVFGPWSGSNLGANLITTKGLSQLELKARGNNPSPSVLSNNGKTVIDYSGDGSFDTGLVAPGSYDFSGSSSTWTMYSTSFTGTVFDRNWVTGCTTFQSTGHWLLASLFGYCGAHLAAFLSHRRRESTRI